MAIKFYKSSTTGTWTLSDNHKCPTGLFIMRVEGAKVSLFARDGRMAVSGLVSDFVKENGQPYASLSELDAVTSDFFSTSGGSSEAGDTGWAYEYADY